MRFPKVGPPLWLASIAVAILSLGVATLSIFYNVIWWVAIPAIIAFLVFVGDRFIMRSRHYFSTAPVWKLRRKHFWGTTFASHGSFLAAVFLVLLILRFTKPELEVAGNPLWLQVVLFMVFALHLGWQTLRMPKKMSGGWQIPAWGEPSNPPRETPEDRKMMIRLIWGTKTPKHIMCEAGIRA